MIIWMMIFLTLMVMTMVLVTLSGTPAAILTTLAALVLLELAKFQAEAPTLDLQMVIQCVSFVLVYLDTTLQLRMFTRETVTMNGL